MSLATRCPACGTVFRVVQDQLKVSGGWVRCGQCHEVFNGLQTLFELPADPPAEPAPSPAATPTGGLFVAQEAPPPPPDTWETAEPQAQNGWPSADDGSTVDLADQPPEPEPAPEQLIDPDAAPAPAPLHRIWAYTPSLADDAPSEAETVIPADATGDDSPDATAFTAVENLAARPEEESLLAVDETAAPDAAAPTATPTQSFLISQPPALPANWQDNSTAAAEAPEPEALTHPDAANAPDLAEDGPVPVGADAALTSLADAAANWPPKRPRRSKRQRKPAFMRQAERAARWRSPGVRAVLGSASAILGVMLALQVVHHLRDDLAASWPATRGLLTTWCQRANCQLKPPRALGSITLDSSALSKTAHPQVLRFEAELRNSAGHAVMAPALDVSFTDNLGHQLARKVLLPEQLGAPPEGLSPNQPWHIEVPLQVGELQIAGFTAEVFYP